MKIDENSWYWQRNSSYLLNDLRNLNEIFRKDVRYDNIKSHKKPGFHPPAVLGLKQINYRLTYLKRNTRFFIPITKNPKFSTLPLLKINQKP